MSHYNNIKHPDIGKKVIIRTDAAGVHYGTLISKNRTECILKDSIRIWQWAGAFTLSQLAMEGSSDPENCVFSMAVTTVTIQYIEIIPCENDAIKSIEGIAPCKK
ncbi:MAG: hypothetical protein V3V14_08130 [Saprospiraceae bacterium]